MPSNEIIARILGIVADEQGFLASILSAEADKAVASAALITPLVFPEDEDPNVILNKALAIEGVVIGVINAVACKEIAIAAKVAAVLGNTVGPISLTVGPCIPGTTVLGTR
ncbi:MAG: hypothetical protein GX795_11645 [Firmicutes bacterium]|jgi:hypothetical protein|nr:hypothetical protein [Bacillota bacterium]